MKISDIKPYENNAKKHPESQLLLLAKIVAEIGWRQPVLVNQQGVIIAGHGRWFSYQQFKDEYNLPEIWVIDDKGNNICGKPDNRQITADQEKFYRIADNKVSETEWDIEKAMLDLRELPETLLGMTGFDEGILDLEYNFKNTELEHDDIEQGAKEHKTRECPSCGYEF